LNQVIWINEHKINTFSKPPEKVRHFEKHDIGEIEKK